MKKNKQKPSFRFICVLIGLIVLACIGLFFLLRPQPVWIVEDRFLEVWENVLDTSPLKRAKLVPLSSVESDSSNKSGLPRNWYGYRIDSIGTPYSLNGDENFIRVHRRLTTSGRHEEALALAIDPWLVFRKFTSPALTREHAEIGFDEIVSGITRQILMAGNDQAAIRAWAAQHLQEAPGIFPQDHELWEQASEQLFQGRLFQTGARTFHWEELWPRLLGDDEIIWVYAPLSRIRQLPLFETNSLEADVFPSRPGWAEFGLQAEILWANPFGNQKNRERLGPVETWLQSASFQTGLADTLGWIAVNPESPPFNPVSGYARLAWLTSSYVWTYKP